MFPFEREPDEVEQQFMDLIMPVPALTDTENVRGQRYMDRAISVLNDNKFKALGISIIIVGVIE